MKFLNNVDLTKNQIIRTRLENGKPSTVETNNNLNSVDFGYIMIDNSQGEKGNVNVWTGSGWKKLAWKDEIQLNTNYYLSEATIVKGTWDTPRTSFTPSTTGNDYALKLKVTGGSTFYVDMTGQGVHTTPEIQSLIGQEGLDTSPVSGDTLDTAIAKCWNRLQNVIAQGGGDVNKLEGIKINSTVVPIDGTKYSNILFKITEGDGGSASTTPVNIPISGGTTLENPPYFEFKWGTDTTSSHNGYIFVNDRWRQVYKEPDGLMTVDKCFCKATITGDGTSNLFTIDHHDLFKFRFCSVTVYDAKTGEIVMIDTHFENEGLTSILFAVAPENGKEYDAFFIGYEEALIPSGTVRKQIVDPNVYKRNLEIEITRANTPE